MATTADLQSAAESYQTQQQLAAAAVAPVAAARPQTPELIAQKLAANHFVGDEQVLDRYFLGTIYQLDLQAVEQRNADLAGKLRELGPSGLDPQERAELTQLLNDARALRALINEFTAPA